MIQSVKPVQQEEPKATQAVALAPTPERAQLSTEGLTTAEYAYEAMRQHQEQFKGQGKQPPAILRWMGDAALAVLPKNRMFCAIGLTAGLMTGGNLAKIATGYGLDGKIVEKAKVPTFLQGMHKIVKNYDPKGLDSRNKWIRYGQWGAYSLGGLIGVKIGTDYAYRTVNEKNKDPHYLEDYLTRISMHQGETWSWLAAFSGIFGSASGLFSLPIPGLNYAVGMAGRTTSMQDRNFMITGMNEMLSGATTPSYLRLKEGLNYLCHYAVGNPAKTPTQFEFLAFTLLGPVFKDQLKPEHIKQFADAIHEVRDPYWQEGGIPREKRAEALSTMKEVFTGAGLEILLIDMGLNPASIAFDQQNGLAGKIGNIGALKKIQADQKAYAAALKERLSIYVADDKISQAQADWVLAGMDALAQRKPAPPAPAIEAAPEPAAPEASSVQPQSKPTDSKGFSDRISTAPSIKPRDKSIEKLIKAAQKDTGDWRESTLRQKQNKENFPVVE